MNKIFILIFYPTTTAKSMLLYASIKVNLSTKPKNASHPGSIMSSKSYFVDILRFHLFLQHSSLHRVTSLESVSFKSCLKQILEVRGTSEPSSLSTQLLKITFWRSLFPPPKTSTWLISQANIQYFWSADIMDIHTATPFSLCCSNE